jgi:hypothetical protein
MTGNMLLAYKLPFKNERLIYINSLPFPFRTLVYGAISPDISGYLNFK